MSTLRRISFQWDRAKSLLWACADMADGRTFKVGFPLAKVELLFAEELTREGIPTGPRVGGYPSTDEFVGWVDGLGRHYDGEPVGASRPPVVGSVELMSYQDEEPEVGKFRFGRRIKRAFRRATKRVARKAKGLLKRTGRLGRKLVRSKALGWAVRGAALAFPAVGGPALAAYTAAKTASAIAKRGARAARATGRALRRGNVRRAIHQGRQVAAQARRLRHATGPQARMLRSALQSVR